MNGKSNAGGREHYSPPLHLNDFEYVGEHYSLSYISVDLSTDIDNGYSYEICSFK